MPATKSVRTARPAATKATPAKKAAARPAVKATAKTAPKAPAAKPAAKTAVPASVSASPAADTGVAKPKHKLVRDSFTIPKAEFAVLDGLKARAADLKRPTKKSEVLRAGIAALAALDDKAFLAALNAIDSLKTGRPKADGTKAR